MELTLTLRIVVSVLYASVMYLLMQRIYNKKNLRFTRTDLLIRASVAGGLFFVIMTILGGMN